MGPVNVRLTIDPNTVVTVSFQEYQGLLALGLIYSVEGGSVVDWPDFTPAQYAELETGTERDGFETADRTLVDGTATIASGILQLSYAKCRKTRTIATLEVLITTAAAATPTLSRIGLYLEDPTTKALSLVASTPNDTALFTAVGIRGKGVSVPYQIQRNSRYAIGALTVTAATAPTFGRAATVSGLSRLAPAIAAQMSGQTDLPASISTGTADTAVNLYAAGRP